MGYWTNQDIAALLLTLPSQLRMTRMRCFLLSVMLYFWSVTVRCFLFGKQLYVPVCMHVCAQCLSK